MPTIVLIWMRSPTYISPCQNLFRTFFVLLILQFCTPTQPPPKIRSNADWSNTPMKLFLSRILSHVLSYHTTIITSMRNEAGHGSCLHREQPEHAPVRWPPQLRLLRGHANRRVFLMGVRPARRQLWRQAQRPAIPDRSAAQPPLRQGGAGGQGQLAACSAGLLRRRDLQQWVASARFWRKFWKMNFSRENQIKAGYCFSWAERELITLFFNFNSR